MSNLDQRINRIRQRIKDLAAAGTDPVAVEILEELRQVVELVADQAFDISHNRLPDVEDSARAALQQLQAIRAGRG